MESFVYRVISLEAGYPALQNGVRNYIMDKGVYNYI